MRRAVRRVPSRGLVPLPLRLCATAVVIAVAGAAGAACGGDSGTRGPGEGGSETPKTIEVTFEDGSVSPNGGRVEVAAGQPVTLEVTADEPGEIHVHSAPEQSFEYAAGTSTFEFTVDRPGVVEVESHDLDQVILQLEVR